MSNFFGPQEDKLLSAKMDDPAYVVRELSAEERAVVEQRRLELAKLFHSDRIVANHKLEVTFGKGRSIHTHFPGSVMVFRSGSAFGGEGDEPLFPCPDDRCPGFITPELVSQNLRIAICPKCTRQFAQSELYDQRLFRLAVPQWSHVLARYFLRLGSDADIYLKTHPEDIRRLTLDERTRYRGGETVNRARKKRVRVLYSLHSIVADLGNGADLEGRLRAFLEA